MIRHNRIELLLGAALLFHLLWFFGNLYEEVLIPNSIVASIAQINAYNQFFSVTEPYYYYVPLSQLGTLIAIFLAFAGDQPNPAFKRLVRWGAGASTLALLLTVYIVTQYNLKMFFGPVDHFGEPLLHQLYLEWGLLNALRILLTGTAGVFLFRAYRGFLRGQYAG